jgi:hypothetical protein
MAKLFVVENHESWQQSVSWGTHLEAFDMVLYMVMEGQKSPHKLIESGFLDVARQHDNADKTPFGFIHILLNRRGDWHGCLELQCMVMQ